MIQGETAGWENLKYNEDDENYKIEIMLKVAQALKDNNIEIKLDAVKIDITSYTTMHNDFRDMPPMLRNIYFCLMEEMPGNVCFKRTEDHL